MRASLASWPWRTRRWSARCSGARRRAVASAVGRPGGPRPRCRPSMRSAISTSSAASSSFTLPISFRYMWTGSAAESAETVRPRGRAPATMAAAAWPRRPGPLAWAPPAWPRRLGPGGGPGRRRSAPAVAPGAVAAATRWGGVRAVAGRHGHDRRLARVVGELDARRRGSRSTTPAIRSALSSTERSTVTTSSWVARRPGGPWRSGRRTRPRAGVSSTRRAVGGDHGLDRGRPTLGAPGGGPVERPAAAPRAGAG